MISKNLLKNEKGMALLPVAAFGWFMLALATTYFDLLSQEKRAVGSSQNNMKAASIVDAAIEETFWRYNYGGGYDSTNTNSLVNNGWVVSGSDLSLASGSARSIADTSGSTIGTYFGTITNYTSTTPTVTIYGSHTPAIGTLITGNTSKAMAQLQPKPLVSSAIQSQGKVTMDSNTSTNSYTGGQTSASDYGNQTPSGNGSVVTNSTASGAIGSSGTINGTANTGPSGTVSGTSVTGTTSHTSTASIPAVIVPTALTALVGGASSRTISSSTSIGTAGSTTNLAYTSLSITGGTVTIAGDTNIYLTDTSGTAFNMDSNTNIRVNTVSSGGAPYHLNIYTNGGVVTSSNTSIGSTANDLNPNGANAVEGLNTSAVVLYGTSTCTSVTMDSNGAFNGVIYAPSAAVELSSNTTVYGAVVGNTVKVDSNSHVYYDTTLPSLLTGSTFSLKWYRRAY